MQQTVAYLFSMTLMNSPLFRTVDEMPPPPNQFNLQKYNDVSAQQFLTMRAGNFNCHLGQRKLLFALLEFLTLCAEKFDKHLRDCILIYIGAAPGLNIQVVLQLFPDLMADLYDPSPIQCRSTNVKLHHQCFADHCIQEVHSRQKELGKKHLLFMSDMRRSVDESVIEDDMKKQAQWARDCLASAVSLKFRLPYDKEVFTYLDGAVYLQLYAPVRSAEARLIAFADAGRFKERQFDVKNYDHKMHCFNLYWRGATSGHPGALQLTSCFPRLYMQKYETAAEYLIVARYIACWSKSRDVVNLIAWLNAESLSTTHQTLQGCHHNSKLGFAKKHRLPSLK